ncbi:MAG: hypothetical protein KBG30_11965 [Bacteroidales bacterium]|nr:hypothetical protein [Bacteroidales bacterium]
MKMKLVYTVMVILAIVVMLVGAGCIDDEPLPPGYGKISVCSSSSSIYGKVYIDGNRIGNAYLDPNSCLFYFANVKLYEEHIVRVENDWGISYTERFYPTYSGYTITVY